MIFQNYNMGNRDHKSKEKKQESNIYHPPHWASYKSQNQNWK